jgi:hypothetical protein
VILKSEKNIFCNDFFIWIIINNKWYDIKSEYFDIKVKIFLKK